MALNPAQTVILMTSMVGVGGTVAGWHIGSTLPEEAEISIGKVVLAGGIILVGVGIASAYLTRR